MLPKGAVTGIYAALAVLCAWLFYARYWLWRDCIHAAESSCITPDGANLTSGGIIWGLLAAVMAALVLRRLLGIGGAGPTPPPA
jgi:hypothetical protein